MSDLLFDISPQRDDSSGKRKPAKRLRQAAAPEENEEPQEPTAAQAYLLAPLGTTDEGECASCGGAYWDILDAHRHEWYCECAYCGLKEWRPEIPGHIKESHTLREGRFAGLTLDQVAKQEYGREYIAACAASHRSPEIQKACQAWLDGHGGTR